MTQAELDAIRDVSPGWGVIEEEIDGKLIRRPVMDGGFNGALFHGPNDPISVIDAHGVKWMIGRLVENGVAGELVKRRSMGGF